MKPPTRTQAFERNTRQEDLLKEINDFLKVAEQNVLTEGTNPRLQKPIVFIVGAPRSGTTLTLQWLASSGAFAYPTNLLSRFFKAPYIGSRIQQLLTDPAFDYKGEMTGLMEEGKTWFSDAGKTRGALQPHEFFYFWRRFFPIDQAQKLSEEQLRDSDPKGFAKGWGLIERAFGKPVAAKGILLQYDIERLAEWLPTAVFIHTRRDPFFNVQSLLRVRERVMGSKDEWFSVKPPEYDWLRDKDATTQVAGQVLFTNRAIETALNHLPPERVLRIGYETFCENPAETWNALRDRMTSMGLALNEYNGPNSFANTNEISCTEEEAAAIRHALQELV